MFHYHETQLIHLPLLYISYHDIQYIYFKIIISHSWQTDRQIYLLESHFIHIQLLENVV